MYKICDTKLTKVTIDMLHMLLQVIIIEIRTCYRLSVRSNCLEKIFLQNVLIMITFHRTTASSLRKHTHAVYRDFKVVKNENFQ